MSFWSDVVANLIGTFAGAGLALLSSWGLSRGARRRTEQRLVQSVVDRLARSRALTHQATDRTGELSPAERDDLRRSTDSILATREYVARVLADLGPRSRAAPLLEEVHGACAGYLRSVETVPEGYATALADLAGHLARTVGELSRADPRLTARRPGETAFLGHPPKG